MLPALFDWSIIGCTILRLALINLKQKITPLEMRYYTIHDCGSKQTRNKMFK